MHARAPASVPRLSARPLAAHGRSSTSVHHGAPASSLPVLLLLQPARRRLSRLRGHAQDVYAPDVSAASGQAESLDAGCFLLQGLRDAQEDAAALSVTPCGHFHFSAVFDGHGGTAASLFLRDHMASFVAKHLPGDPSALDEASARVAMEAAFAAADAALLVHLATCEPDQRESGSTATVALVGGGMLVVANAGDSRAVLLKASGASPSDLTVDHRPAGKGAGAKAEAARVEARARAPHASHIFSHAHSHRFFNQCVPSPFQSVGGWVRDGRVLGVLAVSRALGDPEFKAHESLLDVGVARGLWRREEADTRRPLSAPPVVCTPHVSLVPLPSGQFSAIVLATDGVWDVLSSAQAALFVRAELGRGASAGEAAAALASHAVDRRKSKDNVGVVIVRLE